MKRSKPKSKLKTPPETEIPALFATVHFQSDERPDGYSAEDIASLNAIANKAKPRPPQ
ncbi:hypothetical protein [Brevundimonas sp.]|uniref:hypothetical protein n=1 Tax=Brevundimonas sp. TaxID=1871086 RepID=UPI0035653ECF